MFFALVLLSELYQKQTRASHLDICSTAEYTTTHAGSLGSWSTDVGQAFHFKNGAALEINKTMYGLPRISYGSVADNAASGEDLSHDRQALLFRVKYDLADDIGYPAIEQQPPYPGQLETSVNLVQFGVVIADAHFTTCEEAGCAPGEESFTRNHCLFFLYEFACKEAGFLHIFFTLPLCCKLSLPSPPPASALDFSRSNPLHHIIFVQDARW